MAVNVANTASGLSGDTLITAGDNQTITALKTFDRDPSAPFAVTAASGVVANLDADMVDGMHAADIAGADPTTVEEITAIWTFTANPVFNANAIPETAIADGAVFPRLAGTETITGVWTLDSRSKIKAGSASSLKAGLGGVIYSSVAQGGNTGAGEDTLYTQSIAASVLATDGDMLIIEVHGDFAANGNTKILRFYWNSVAVHSVTTTSTGGWSARIIIGRRGAASQIIVGSVVGATSTEQNILAAGGATLSGAVTFAVTGEATNNNDTTVELVRIAFSPVAV